jgi:hypothetical protein
MIDFAEFLQWDRLITQSIIKIFYFLSVIVAVLLGLTGVFNALLAMSANVLVGFMMLLSSVAGTAVAIIVARIVAELVLVIFRMNDNLEAIRGRGGM